MNKGKSIGICCLLAAVVILAAAFYQLQVESEDSCGTETGNAAKAALPAVSGQEVNAVQAAENDVNKEQPSGQTQTAETEEPEQGEYSQAQMDIRDMNDEVLALMGVTEQRLADEIRVFANGYGFAGMTETHYYGETVIDHKRNTVSAVFYFQAPETGTFKFNVIVQRNKKTFRFEPW